MEIKTVKGQHYTAMEGDSCETIKTLADESVDLSIFSPPFFSLYTYSPSIRDMGNSKDDAEFWTHFKFLIPELFRIIKTGRICAVHCMQVPALLNKDGYIGVKDFRGDIIDNFSDCGFIYHGEFVIPKNPQAQSIRTHSKGLTFTQFEKDSSWSRPALLDYILIFRKPGDPAVAVKNGDFDGSDVTRDEWIDIASGILSHVRETYTLNTIKYDGDERHVCPLQLDVIDVITRLYSNRGEKVYSPFGGIGSEGYQSIINGRHAILGELKPEYFKQMVENLEKAEFEFKQKNNDLFSDLKVVND
jgi:DNA modification methylase